MFLYACTICICVAQDAAVLSRDVYSRVYELHSVPVSSCCWIRKTANPERALFLQGHWVSPSLRGLLLKMPFLQQTPFVEMDWKGKNIIEMKMSCFLLRSAPKMQVSSTTYGMIPGLYLGITLDRIPTRPYKPDSQIIAGASSDNNYGMEKCFIRKY